MRNIQVKPCFKFRLARILRSIRSLVDVALILILTSLLLCGAAEADAVDRGRAPELEWLVLPDSINGRTPRLQSTRNGLLLSWVAGDSDSARLQYSEFRQGGWTTSRTVAEGDGWLINYADYVQVLPLSDDVYLAIWLELTSYVTNGYRFNTSLSRDGGRTWIPTGIPAGIEGYGQHGFASATLQDDLITVFWISGYKADGQLFRANLDMSGRWSKPVLVDDRVCSCCHTAVSESGTLAYRDRSGSEIRDIAIIANAHQSKSSRIVHADNWKLSGCPTNGPAIAESANLTAIGWLNGAHEPATSQLGIGISDYPQSWRVIALNPTGSLGYAGLVWLNSELLVVSSISAHGGIAHINLQLARTGETSIDIVDTLEIPVGTVTGFPTLAVMHNQVYLTFYTPDPGRIRIARIDWMP